MKFSTIRVLLIIIFIIILSLNVLQAQNNKVSVSKNNIRLLILGNIQDAGYPHIACKKQCCLDFYSGKEEKKLITSIALIDSNNNYYLFDCSPDITAQLDYINDYLNNDRSENIFALPNGIFITHAHIGHYTGLMYFGKEAKGANNISTYLMPRMKYYIENNGPWSQLVKQKNISIIELEADKPIILDNNISIIPFIVPHRDEYSETVGYNIITPNKKILFIPDINKWDIWEKNIIQEIKKVDLVFIDGTFYNDSELKNRDMSSIPHPFIRESVELFEDLDPKERRKINFIHFNHTNPAFKTSAEKKSLLNSGFNIAEQWEVFIID